MVDNSKYFNIYHYVFNKEQVMKGNTFSFSAFSGSVPGKPRVNHFPDQFSIKIPHGVQYYNVNIYVPINSKISVVASIGLPPYGMSRKITGHVPTMSDLYKGPIWYRNFSGMMHIMQGYSEEPIPYGGSLYIKVNQPNNIQKVTYVFKVDKNYYENYKPKPFPKYKPIIDKDEPTTPSDDTVEPDIKPRNDGVNPFDFLFGPKKKEKKKEIYHGAIDGIDVIFNKTDKILTINHDQNFDVDIESHENYDLIISDNFSVKFYKMVDGSYLYADGNLITLQKNGA